MEGAAQLYSIKEETLKLDNKNKTTEHEIQIKLGIRDYVTQLQTAVGNLKREKESLERENYSKRERLALADTMTDFLTRQPSYDFDRFYSNVQLIKKMREAGTTRPNLVLSTVEEETRLLALKVFQGDLVSKKDFEALSDNKQECEKDKKDFETKVKQLELKLQESNTRAVAQRLSGPPVKRPHLF